MECTFPSEILETCSSHAPLESAVLNFWNLINQNYTPPFCSFININSFVYCKFSLNKHPRISLNNITSCYVKKKKKNRKGNKKNMKLIK